MGKAKQRGVGMKICKRCNGEMRIPDYNADLDSLDISLGMYKYMPCPDCEGEGEVEYDNR